MIALSVIIFIALTVYKKTIIYADDFETFIVNNSYFSRFFSSFRYCIDMLQQNWLFIVE